MSDQAWHVDARKEMRSCMTKDFDQIMFYTFSMVYVESGMRLQSCTKAYLSRVNRGLGRKHQ